MKLTKNRDIKYTLLIAIFFGLLLVFPRLYLINSIGGEFKGFFPVFVEDEIHYQARINSVLNNGIFDGNTYLYEHKNNPFSQPLLSESILALGSYITGFSVPKISLISIFIFGVICFIFVNKLFFDITKNNIYSLIYSSIFYIFFIQTFGRPISPQLNTIFLLIGIILSIRIYYIDDNKNQIYNSVIGALVGILLFISPYYWTSLILIYSLLMVSRLYINNNFEQFKTSLKYFIPFFLCFFIAYIYLLIEVSYLPGYKEGAERFGLINTHIPGSFFNIFLGLISLFIIFIFGKFLSLRDKLLSLIFGLSIFILNWQNVITGIYFQYSSHYLVVSVLFLMLILSLIHFRIQNNKLFYLLLFIIISFVFYFQVYEIKLLVNQRKNFNEFIYEQNKINIFDWFLKNTDKNSVVYTLGGNYDYLLPVYTNNKVYYNFYVPIFSVTTEEIENRWIINNIFNKNLDKNYIYKYERYIWGNKFIDSYFFKKNTEKIFRIFGYDARIDEIRVPSDFIDKIYNKYKLFTTIDKDKLFGIYKIDYILLSNNYEYHKEAKIFFDKNNRFKLVKNIDGNIIYKFD